MPPAGMPAAAATPGSVGAVIAVGAIAGNPGTDMLDAGAVSGLGAVNPCIPGILPAGMPEAGATAALGTVSPAGDVSVAGLMVATGV